MRRDPQPSSPESVPHSLFDLPLQQQGSSAPEIERTDEDSPTPRPQTTPAKGAEPAAVDAYRAQAEDAEEREEAHESPADGRSKLFVTEQEAAAMAATEAEDLTAASMVMRLQAGVADLAAVSLAVVAGAGGAILLGVRPTAGDWPAFALLAACFSFLYCVVPLAFWGQTPGMSWAGLEARAEDDEPLSFGQTAIRWFAGVLTIALLGLPMLFVRLGGQSVADWLSSSKTLVSAHLS